MIRSRRQPLFVVAAALAATATSACRSAPPSAPPDGPSLVVLMAVDQLRTDLLYGYDDFFTGGLRRLLDEGFGFENAMHDHAHTETAPGHHTLSTGVHPSRHGVVSNTWSEQEGDGWRNVYSVADPDHPILGYPDLPGRSPANTERDGLADWMLDHDSDTRVVSISRKDRAAIGLAARARGEVYWLADQGGEFITSDFYHSDYPQWVDRFNAETMPKLYAQTVWASEVPPEAADATRPDTSRHELDGVHTFFPHLASELVDAGEPAELNHWRYEYTPFPDQAVFALAREAIRTLELGGRSSADFLGISLSQTDLVGHHFGPMSREQLDNLLRLDREMGAFFDFLDEQVGPEQWVMAFSADHGVLDIPELLAEDGLEARRLDRDDRDLFYSTITAADTGGAGSQEAIKAALLELPFVAGAYTFDEIESGQVADSFAVLFANSHSDTRLPALASRWRVHVRMSPNYLEWGASRATHGSPYDYDRQVPLIFMGAGVRSGSSAERAATVDAAPTLARLAGIPAPNDLDGRVLESAIR